MPQNKILCLISFDKEGERLRAKIKLFTHTDLDGAGCAILAKTAFKSFLDIDFCGYQNVDRKIMDFINSGRIEDFFAVFITDISVNEQTAKIIDESYADKVILIDHHDTAEWLNKYGWALVKQTEVSQVLNKEVTASATSLFHSFLYENGLLIGKKYQVFSETVRLYDSWDWFLSNLEIPKQLNDLFFLLGRAEFIQRFVSNPSIELSEVESKMLRIEDNKINYYIKTKMEEMKETHLLDYRIGVIFIEKYHSEVGNALAEKNKKLDFIVMINPARKQVSIRGIKEDIHLGEIAKMFGGGGHKKSAGFQFSSELVENFIKEIL